MISEHLNFIEELGFTAKEINNNKVISTDEKGITANVDLHSNHYQFTYEDIASEIFENISDTERFELELVNFKVSVLSKELADKVEYSK